LAITIAARPAKPGWVAVLLVLGIATGGASLAFLAAVIVLLVLDPDRRRDLWSVIPAIVIYAAWFLTFGRENAPVSFSGSLGELKDLVEWMRMGMSAAVGQSVGLTGEFGLVLLCILAVASLWQLLGRGPYLYGAVAALAGLAAQNALTGLARSGMTGSPPDAPRYVHTGAVFAIIAIAVWYGSRPRPRALNSLPLLVIAGAVIAFNIQVLRWWADSWYTPRSEETRAAIDVALEYGGTPALPGDRAPLDPTDPFLVDIPSPDRLREVIATFGGSPLDDSWQPGTYNVPLDVYERIKSGILGGASPSAAP
jgi:hypothetical protein